MNIKTLTDNVFVPEWHKHAEKGSVVATAGDNLQYWLRRIKSGEAEELIDAADREELLRAPKPAQAKEAPRDNKK